MNNPQIFKADPEAVDAGKALQGLTFLSALPGRYANPYRRPFEEKAKNTDDHIAFQDDQVIAYEDHLEQKHGVAVNEIYFKDITGVEVLRTAEKKIIIYITIIQNGKKNILAGLERMDDLLGIITEYIGQGLIKENTFNAGVAWMAGFKKLTFYFLFFLALLIVLIILNLK